MVTLAVMQESVLLDVMPGHPLVHVVVAILSFNRKRRLAEKSIVLTVGLVGVLLREEMENNGFHSSEN